ncbi:MAG: serine hydrolase [Vicingaceae bacterium]
MRIRLTFLIGALAFCLNVWAQYGKQVEYLDKYISNAVSEYNLPSLSIGIVKDGKVIMQKSYGYLENGKDAKADEHSIYGIASLSKAFTTASIGMLVDQGKMTWDDRVVDHLPYFELHDPYVSSHMTIRDLLSHRAGLATFDGDLLWYATDYSRGEIVRRIKYLPLKQEFRSDYGYQNIMFITAGELIEAVSGMTWDQFVSDRIFKPLGMDRSYTSFEKIDLKDNVTVPHLSGKAIFHLSYDNSGATAAIHSNVDDLCKWLQFWINNGVVGSDTLLSQAVINEIQMQHTVIRTSAFDARSGIHFKGYGLGWFLMDYDGRKVVHHGGGLPGYISKIALVPEENLGMIVLTNDMNWLPSALAYKVIDVFTTKDMDGRDWAGEFLGYSMASDRALEEAKIKRHQARVENTKPSKALDAYTGTFSDAMYGDARISLSEKKLTLEMLPSKELFTAVLNHWHYNTFQFEFKDPFLPEGFLTFEFDSDGDVTGFTIDLPNPDFHFFNLHFKRK